MASKHSGNENATQTPQTVIESEIRTCDTVKTERTVAAPPEKEVAPLDDYPTVNELTPSAETTIPKKVHLRPASKVHPRNGTAPQTPKPEIPLTAAKETELMVAAEVKEQKEMKSVADHPTVTEVATAAVMTNPEKNLRGRPGVCLFRVIVPVDKVESIIGPNGDLIKKMCEETKASICVLESPACDSNRIVLISGKEDIETPLSPAMDAVVRVFKHVNGFPENGSDGVASNSFCSIRLLLTSMQATSLIGKKESPMKTIHENTGCSVCILSSDEVSNLCAKSDDRVLRLHGKALKVLEALEAVLRHLNMFLVDYTILPPFGNTHNTTFTQEKHKVVAWAAHTSSLSQRESRGPQQKSHFPYVTQISPVEALNMIGIEGKNISNIGRTSGAVFTAAQVTKDSQSKNITSEIKGTQSQAQTAHQLTQVAQMMEIPLIDVIDMMRIGGTNFGCTSGATFTFQESKVTRKQIQVEIKGTPSQVLAAQKLIKAKTVPRRTSFGSVRPEVDQFAQTVHIPLADVVRIIGVGGSNFGCTSGAIFTVRNTPISQKRITVEIRGTSSQVEAARQLIQAKSGPGRTSFGTVRRVVDQALTRPPHVAAGPSGEVPPSATVETKIEPIVLSSLAGVPPKLPQVQPASDIPPPSHVCNTQPPAHSTATSPGMESMKIRWQVNIVETFLDACIHQITHEGASLKAMPWKKIGETLKDKHNVSVDDTQMERCLNGFKWKYKAWVSLKNKSPNIYDPSTKTFNLTDKEWETEIKKNKCIGTLRTSPLQYPDLCAQIFDDHALTEREPPPATSETPQKESLIEVPPELPPVQPATASVTIAEVPSELPQVQPMAIETKAEVAVSIDEVAMQMEVDLPPPSNRSRRRAMLLPPHVTATSSGMENMQEAKRSRVSWENMEVVKTFLDVCIHEITINGRESATLKPMSWKKVGEMLKDRHNFSVDLKQMKNYFDGLKSKYSAWLSLKNKTNMYDPSTNTFNLTDKEWEIEIKKNKCVETLRKEPLPFPNLCAQLFDCDMSTDDIFQAGVDQDLTAPEPGEVIHEPQASVEPQKEAIVSSSMVEVAPEMPQVQPATALVELETETVVPTQSPQVQPPQPASEVVAIGTKRSMTVFEEEMLGVLKMIADKMNKPGPPPKPTFEDCENKLNELGWPKHDPLNLIALTIFCDENDRYRELWMKLQPDRCANWVRMIGRSKRFT